MTTKASTSLNELQAALDRFVADHESQVESLKEDVNASEAEIDSIKAQKAVTENEYKELRRRFRTVNTACNTNLRRINALEEEVNSIMEDRYDLCEQHQIKVFELKAALRSGQLALGKKDDQLKIQEGENVRLRAAIEKHESAKRVGSYSFTATELSVGVAAIAAPPDAVQTPVSRKRKDVQEVSDENDGLSDERRDQLTDIISSLKDLNFSQFQRAERLRTTVHDPDDPSSAIQVPAARYLDLDHMQYKLSQEYYTTTASFENDFKTMLDQCIFSRTSSDVEKQQALEMFYVMKTKMARLRSASRRVLPATGMRRRRFDAETEMGE